MPLDSRRQTGVRGGADRRTVGKGEAGQGDGDLGEVFFEFRPIGNYMRVDAIHARTGTETYVLGPLNAPSSTLQMLALRKLKTVLDRKSG